MHSIYIGTSSRFVSLKRAPTVCHVFASHKDPRSFSLSEVFVVPNGLFPALGLIMPIYKLLTTTFFNRDIATDGRLSYENPGY